MALVVLPSASLSASSTASAEQCVDTSLETRHTFSSSEHMMCVSLLSWALHEPFLRPITIWLWRWRARRNWRKGRDTPLLMEWLHYLMNYSSIYDIKLVSCEQNLTGDLWFDSNAVFNQFLSICVAPKVKTTLWSYSKTWRSTIHLTNMHLHDLVHNVSIKTTEKLIL